MKAKLIRERKANLVAHVVKVIQSCNRREQLEAAEKYALLWGLRFNPIVNENLIMMTNIYSLIR